MFLITNKLSSTWNAALSYESIRFYSNASGKNWQDIVNRNVSYRIVKQPCRSFSIWEISLPAPFHLIRHCQTLCNFIWPFYSIWPIPMLITQCFSGWVSRFSFFLSDAAMNWVHFHHYPLLQHSVLTPSMLEVVSPFSTSPKHSNSVWYCPYFRL